MSSAREQRRNAAIARAVRRQVDHAIEDTAVMIVTFDDVKTFADRGRALSWARRRGITIDPTTIAEDGEP